MIQIRKVQKWTGKNIHEFEEMFPEVWVTVPESDTYLQMQVKNRVWLLEVGDGFMTEGDGTFQSIRNITQKLYQVMDKESGPYDKIFDTEEKAWGSLLDDLDEGFEEFPWILKAISSGVIYVKELELVKESEEKMRQELEQRVKDFTENNAKLIKDIEEGSFYGREYFGGDINADDVFENGINYGQYRALKEVLSQLDHEWFGRQYDT